MPQFKPGQSGNPAGRKKGSLNRQLAALREAADKILPLVVEKALAGDADAQKLILERALPRMKALSPPEAFSLPDGNPSEQAQALLQQVAAGELSATVAAEVVGMAAAAAKLKEVGVQEQPQLTQADCAKFAKERLAELRARREEEKEKENNPEDNKTPPTNFQGEANEEKIDEEKNNAHL